MLLAGATFVGRDPQQYEHPDVFDPDRFQTAPNYLPWIPFGEGMHSCPGQWLAKTEILLFTAALLQRYRIQSFPDVEMKLKGYMTLKTDEDVELILNSLRPTLRSRTATIPKKRKFSTDLIDSH